jgi:hypothetical protein
MVYDSSEALRLWATELGSGGHRAEVAELILSGIQELTPETWTTFRELLKSEPTPVKKVLLRSLCALASIQGKLPDSEWTKTVPVLHALERAAFQDMPILLDPEDTVVEVARELYRAGYHDAHTIGAHADAMLEAKAQRFADILNQPPSQIKPILHSIGRSFWTWIDGSDPEADKAAQIVEQEPELFPILLHWLIDTLNKNMSDDMLYQKCRPLLTVTATAAQRMPSAFANLADPREMEPLLVDAIRLHNHVYGRRAALTLLSYLRRVTPGVVDALFEGLRSAKFMQRAALDSIGRFRSFEGNILPPLLDGLQHQSAITAYGTARLLSVYARSERVKPEQRRMIIEALTNAIRHPRSRQAVYMLEGTGNDNENPVRIRKETQLDQAFYQAVLEISGML